MGILYISEYEQLAPSPMGHVGQIAQEPPIATQAVTFSTATASSAFNAKTRFVRLHTDGICSYVFDTAPVATTSDSRMVAGQTEYHGVPINQSYKVSAVSNT